MDEPDVKEIVFLLTNIPVFFFSVSAKHKETKQYFTLYNTLDDTRLYIKKELTLLNSILDSYPE